MNEWPHHSFLELAALPTAVPCARLHAKHLVWEWGLEQLAPDVELIVSELTTNAVQATVEVAQDGRAHRSIGSPRIELCMFSDEDQMLIEVWDGNQELPEPQGLGVDGIPGLGEESGRGLFLVETLSEQWGYYPTPAAQAELISFPRGSHATVLAEPRILRMVGKVVWALLA